MTTHFSSLFSWNQNQNHKYINIAKHIQKWNTQYNNFYFKLDQRCSSNSKEEEIAKEHVSHNLLFYCTCPGCTIYSSLPFVFVIMVVVLIVCFSMILYLKTRPSANYNYIYATSCASQYEKINETVLWNQKRFFRSVFRTKYITHQQAIR